MTRYAENTSVSSDKSRGEIEKTLMRYGATGFMYGWQGTTAKIAFMANEKQVLFNLPLPSINEFRLTETGRDRSASQVEKAYEQAVRQRWRALALCIKAKLEAVECGITTFEEEFLAHFAMPDGLTLGAKLIPELESACLSGKMPKLLPM